MLKLCDFHSFFILQFVRMNYTFLFVLKLSNFFVFLKLLINFVVY